MTHIEIIQSLYRAYRSQDYETFRALCMPDIAWIQSEGFPGGGTWIGADAIIKGVFQGNADRWEGFGFDIEQYLDAGNSVIVVGAYRGTHRVSARSFRAATVHIFDLQEGRVARFRQFTDTKVICDALPATSSTGAPARTQG